MQQVSNAGGGAWTRRGFAIQAKDLEVNPPRGQEAGGALGGERKPPDNQREEELARPPLFALQCVEKVFRHRLRHPHVFHVGTRWRARRQCG